MFMKVIKRNQIIIFVGALMLIVALFLIFKPAESLSLITILFGLIIMIDGVIHIINYFKIDPTQKLMSFELVEGLIEVFAGAVITVCADGLIEFLPIIFAVWIILKSLITFQMALNIKTVPNTSWGLMVVVAIIGILLGFIYKKYKNIWINVSIHGTWNLIGAVMILTKIMLTK